jgi:Na+-translocating ferredoxin:NAD+ oxidoreductase RnfG subunit
MNWTPHKLGMAGGIIACASWLTAPITVQAKIYVSQEQAQQLIFPGKSFGHTPMLLTDEMQAILRKKSGVRQPVAGHRIWQSPAGDWFIVDQVVGKHEMITYALGINADGSVQGIEIMEYLESYGHEVAQMNWRKQFHGKKVSDAVQLNQDIQNISGATLSSKHLTDGIKRLLVLHAMVLSSRSPK